MSGSRFEVLPVVPELMCSDFDTSLAFYVDVLGFHVASRNGEAKHAFVQLDCSQLMLMQSNERWHTADLEHPYGRGVCLQIFVNDVRALHDRAVHAGCEIYHPLEEVWYFRRGRDDCQRQIIVLDPDGFMLMFAQVVGTRPPSPT